MLQDSGFPFVVVDPRVAARRGDPGRLGRHRAGAKAATEHLLSLGHRRIGDDHRPRGWAATEERLDGYHDGARRGRACSDAELIVEGNFDERERLRGGTDVLLDLPDRRPRSSRSNDNMAVGALRAARERGLRVPERPLDRRLRRRRAGADRHPGADDRRQPLAELGRTAVSLLTRLIEGQRVEALRVELATRLIVRESTGPPPSKR